MGSNPGDEIDRWLADGGLVVTANERAARALRMEYHRRRRAEGLTAWPTPHILAWMPFVREAWDARGGDGLMLLNSEQERALWCNIISADTKNRGLSAYLEAPRRRLADMAMTAHELLCSYGPRYLTNAMRTGWDGDPGVFSAWLAKFGEICRSARLLSASCIALELLPKLQEESLRRKPIQIVGFDRLQPVQRDFLNAWGHWTELEPSELAREIYHFAAADSNSELDACAAWASQYLARKPDARVLIIDQNIATRRGEIERTFLRRDLPGTAPPFEFSLGMPLIQVPIARAALLLLRWLSGSLEEHELDWLFSSGFAAADRRETLALQELMRTLRRRGQARTEWPLSAFLTQRPESTASLEAWQRRIAQARHQLLKSPRRKISPSEWVGRVPELLDALGLPGKHRLSSAEFQAWRAWEHALDTCASLGFDGRQMEWKEFISVLEQVLGEALFTPESRDAPIQVMGPAEAAGLTADAVWFMGAHQDAWPATGSAHPFIPQHVQRESAMPHATHQLDWELGRAITKRLLASAPLIHFSYAMQTEDGDTRSSRLVEQIAGRPEPLPDHLQALPPTPQFTQSFQDFSRIPFSSNRLPGGARVLTDQSNCAFKAFATSRLGAQGWERAEFGLTAKERGLLLHSVVHAVWAGPPDGIRSLADLRAVADIRGFVRDHVRKTLDQDRGASIRDRVPERHLELEQVRLTHLVTEWLQYEARRHFFSVEKTEVPGEVTIAGITFNLRLDRIDRLKDDSLLVIDYKSGDVSPKDWDLPRPADVQLPLYACFAIAEGEQLGGLVFAKLRPGEEEFTGRVRRARSTLVEGFSAMSDLVKKPLTPQQVADWKRYIEGLALEFLAGRADVNPRKFPETCERCTLSTLCRVSESRTICADDLDAAGGGGARDD